MNRKIGIIGVGHVGAHVASALLWREIADELVLIDLKQGKAAAEARELSDASCYLGRNARVCSGSYEDLKDASLVVISACAQIARKDRLEELDDALAIMDEISPRLLAYGFCGQIVSITNPCDLIACYLHQITGLPVIGTGTLLDSARFRVGIAKALSLRPADVTAYCVGEHGESQVPLWSTVRVGGLTLDDYLNRRPELGARISREEIYRKTVSAGWDIFSEKQCTEYGIAAAAAELCDAILSGSEEIMPCSIPMDCDGIEIYASVPCQLRKGEAPLSLLPKISEEEQEAFAKSRQLMRHYCVTKLIPRHQGD